MKKLLSFLLIILLMTSSVFGQAKAELKPEEPIVLSFWNGFTGPDGEVLSQLVGEFNASQSNIKVEMDVMGWDILSQKLPPSIATKTAPDMALLIGDWIPQYIDNGSIRNLDDFWNKTGLKQEAYLKNVLELGIYNGTYYSLPMQFNLIYLFWNKALFAAAGLNPDNEPKTMAELADFARKLTIPASGQYGFGLPVKGAPEYWTSFFWNNGGELFDLKTKKSLLNSPQNVKTLAWVQDLVVKGKVSPAGASGAEMENLFMSGKLAMYINGPWMIGGIRNNNIDFGISVVPKGDARQQVIGGNIGFIVPSSTSDERVAAVCEFIKFWMSDAVLKEWSLKNGFPAWSHNVLKDQEIVNDAVLGKISPLSSMGRPYNPEAFEGISALNMDALWPMMESVISGGAAPQAAIEKASLKIDSIFADFK